MTKIKSFIASLIVVAIIAISTAGTANAFYLGQTGPDVLELQATLIESGFDIPAITNGKAAFGYFGVQTQKALAASEASQGTPSIKLGAVSTLDGVDNPYISVNGFKTYEYRQPIVATSSTFCSIRNPFNATTTIKNYHVSVTSNGLGSQLFDISTSSTALASSSPAFVKNFSGGTGQFQTVWNSNGTTTNALLIGTAQGNVGFSNVIIGPAEYITAKISTSTAGTFASYYVGSCQGEIVRL